MTCHQLVIKQYGRSSSFFIELCFDENPSSINYSIIKTASKYCFIMKQILQELESYLKNGDFSVFEDYSAKQMLSDSSRRALVCESVNFLRQ